MYGGLKYLIHYGKKPVFRFVSYEENKNKKTKKDIRMRVVKERILRNNIFNSKNHNGVV